nr:hypothetical protein [Tanacetum cinerariifolium]
TGLPECADDTVTDYSRPLPTVESSSEEDQNRNPSVSENVASPIIPKPFIKFVKASDSQSKSKTNEKETPKKPPVKYAEQYRKPNKKPNVRGNQRNWNNLKSHQLGPDFVMKKKTCFNCGDFNLLAYECRKRVERGTPRSQNNTYKSPSHRPVVHRPNRSPMRSMRPNMNCACSNRTSFNKSAHSYTNRPFQRKSAVKTQYRAPWMSTVNRNFPPVNRKFSTDHDRATIAKSSTLPHDSAPRVTSPAAEEGRVIGDRSGDDAPIKRRSMDEREASTERVSDDTKEMATVLTSIDAATVLASGVVNVPTGSGSIPTASTPAEGSRRRKGKEVMVESETPKKQKVQEQIDAQVARDLEEKLTREDQRRAEQIARDAEIVRIHAEEELQSMIDGLDSNNETVAKYLEEYYQFSSELHMERRIELISDLAKDFKGMTFEEVEAKFNSVCKQMEDFIPMGSKEEAERIKRKGINLEQESAKKQKLSEEITEEAKSSEEVIEEKIKEMMQLVPIEEVYMEELQFKHPIIVWEVHTEGQRAYWKITRLGGSSASYQFFTDLLKHLDRDDLNQLWSLVNETLSKRPATSDKEIVHQLTSKDKDIFILVEKDYPLRKGLTLVMICYKLQVENYSQMADDLVRKIYNIANSPR